MPYGNFEDHGKLWDSPAVRTVMAETLTGTAPAADFVHAGVHLANRRANFCLVATDRGGRPLPGARYDLRGKGVSGAITDRRGVVSFGLPAMKILGPRNRAATVTIRVTWTGGSKDVKVRVAP